MKEKVNRLDRLVNAWVELITRWPWYVIGLFIALSGLCLNYTIENLRVNTNTGELISMEVPFQKNRVRLEQAFPQDIGTAVVFIEGKTPEATTEAVDKFKTLADQHREAIQSVYLPDEGDFFSKNGLLFLDKTDLESLSEKLSSAQPFIGYLAKHNSLEGFLHIVEEALTNSSGDLISQEIDPILVSLERTISGLNAGKDVPVSWQTLMTPNATGLGITKRFIYVKPVIHFEEMMPAEQAMNALKLIQKEIKSDFSGLVNVRITGEVALEHEEMVTISSGVSIAGAVSLVMVCLTLWFAYQSAKLMIATFVSLSMGLIFSLGFATLAIGQLNLISIGFAVLFIGMGDAYSSHFCLRYRELVLEGKSTKVALRETMRSAGPALALSAITAAIGLFSYIPTRYSGVAELGIIAGTSMFIALGTTFSVLPALIKILPLKSKRQDKQVREENKLLFNWPLVFARPIRYASLILALVAVIGVLNVKVDFNPLNLRDPETESVQTFKYLLQSEDTSPMTLAALASNENQAAELRKAFLGLSTVDRVIGLQDFIPGDQPEKLEIIRNTELLMGSDLNHYPNATCSNPEMIAVLHFRDVVRHHLQSNPDSSPTQELAKTLDLFIERADSLAPDNKEPLLCQLQNNLIGSLPPVIRDLAKSLTASEFGQNDLPKELLERWISSDGLYRLQIFPKKNLDDVGNLREFIVDAQTVDPNVTDLPVTYLESMKEVIGAFQEAFAIAFTATALILILVLRNIRDTLLVLLPLVLASLFTAASTAAMGVAFNFANIIALPLLFGLGVDSGIHMAHRLHYLEKHKGQLLAASEAKGVFYGALTTVFSFSSLAFTAHKGTASMGLLLSIGLLYTLICALVVLPAFSDIRIRALRSR